MATLLSLPEKEEMRTRLQKHSQNVLIQVKRASVRPAQPTVSVVAPIIGFIAIDQRAQFTAQRGIGVHSNGAAF